MKFVWKLEIWGFSGILFSSLKPNYLQQVTYKFSKCMVIIPNVQVSQGQCLLSYWENEWKQLKEA